MNNGPGSPVVVTTEHRGVFFGYLDGDRAADAMELSQAQMCVFWSSSVHGVLGLAATGPDRNCRVTPPVPSITLHKVTAVMDATEEASQAWTAQPWSQS